MILKVSPVNHWYMNFLLQVWNEGQHVETYSNLMLQFISVKSIKTQVLYVFVFYTFIFLGINLYFVLQKVSARDELEIKASVPFPQI